MSVSALRQYISYEYNCFKQVSILTELSVNQNACVGLVNFDKRNPKVFFHEAAGRIQPEGTANTLLFWARCALQRSETGWKSKQTRGIIQLMGYVRSVWAMSAFTSGSGNLKTV